jgi:Cdc6-like AAA superfamily ATPase
MGQTGDVFTQYGLLAGRSSENDAKPTDCDFDPRLFYNIAAPSSVFICGSQGTGKSHTLACLLENCLVPSEVNVLPRPLTGVVFHYDTFNSDTGGLPCEAAHLSTSSSVKVRVLCSPTNIRQIRVSTSPTQRPCALF